MKVSQFYVGLVVITMAFGFEGCNSGSSSGTSKTSNSTGRSPTGECSSSSSSSSGETCSGEDEYYTCLQQACGSQYQACFGANYRNGSFSGTCKTEMDCIYACSCEDPNCSLTCYKNATQACINCFDAIDSCEEKSGCVEPECGSTGAGGAAATGAGGATAKGGSASTSTVQATGGSLSAAQGGAATMTSAVAEGGAEVSGVGGSTAVGICPYTTASFDCATACTNLKAIASKCQSDPSLSADIQAILAAAATGSGTTCKATCASLSPSNPTQWKCYQAVPTTADCTAIAGCTYYNCPP